jgi:predicted lipid carrier protein YhbT
MNANLLNHSPSLPRLLRLPVHLVPGGLRNSAFVRALNVLFGEELDDGELDFMADRVVAIHIDDAALDFHFRVRGGRFVVADRSSTADLSIAGSLYDFLLLVSRREDPDTLFFNRRLKLCGNTELGLYVKNFLDAVDFTERFQWLYRVSHGASRVAEKLPFNNR